jgi:hypothetical protein
MAGPFSLLTGFLGESDPGQDMADWSNENQKRNRAALGLDANGNPLPAPTAAPAAPGGAAAPSAQLTPGQQATIQAQVASTLPAQQEPNATKTPQSLGATMMNLAQYEQREQGFNQALGMGFAAFAQPRDRQMVSGMFNTTPLDANKLAQTQMSLGSQQQGQDRANAVARMVNNPDMGPKIAQAFGMDWDGLKAGVLADPGLVARIAETWGTADEKVRAGAQVGHGALGGGGPGGPVGPGGAPNPITDIGKQIVSGVGGQQDMTAAQMDWDTKHPGQPTPWNRNDPESFKRYTQDLTERQTSAQDFGKIHGSSIDKVTEFQHRVEALKTDPGMQQIMDKPNFYKQALQWLQAHKGDTPEMAAQAAPEWAAQIAGFTPEVKNALTEIQLLRSRDYANAMHSIGQRFSTQEVQNVSKGMDTLLDTQLSKDDYNAGLDRLIDETKTIRANSHGAAQDFDTMDPDLRTYVNPTFTKGGRRNVEGSGSEDWADKVKPPPEEIEKAKAAIARGVARPDVERLMRSRGFRPMGF